MNKITFFIIIVVLLGLGGWWLIGQPDPEPGENGHDLTTALTVEYDRDGERLELRDQQELVFEITIEEFNDWTVEHWSEIFPDGVSFGELRPVESGQFARFDQGAAVSPSGELLAFAVSDYAAASTMTFVAVVEIETGAINLIDEEVMGAVDQISWSPDSTHLAYILHSARAQNDSLSVDNVETLSKQITLGLVGESLIERLELDSEVVESDYMPNFLELRWSEAGRELYFSTDHPENQERELEWRMERDGAGLELVE